MQISLTRKLAKAIGVEPAAADESINPLFCWTANWTNTFSDRKEDMIVMVNQATRFTVAIYGVRRNQFKKIQEKMIAAIKNTFIALNFNDEIIDEYLKLAGDINYASNKDRKMTAQVNHQAMSASHVVAALINYSGVKIKYEDTLGGEVSRLSVNHGSYHEDEFIPFEEMKKALADLTGKPIYKYRAFELLLTLDLGIYTATRQIIVPANLSFHNLHKIIQNVYDWQGYHLYEFSVLENNREAEHAKLVAFEESLEYYDNAIVMDQHQLSEYLPAYKRMIYVYDLGDYWEHEIELLRVIGDCDHDSPYLVKASGQAPPEDVGGVGGYMRFREIMLDPKNPEYDSMKEWAGYWTPELAAWKARPRRIDPLL